MSILIQGMEMPKNCAECKMWSICDCLNDFEDFESICDAVEDGDLVRDKNCPLIEILTPHGRLIDKDKLSHDLFVNFNGERIPFYDYDNFPTEIAYRDLHSILAEQKTVIESEGREKE